MDSNKQRVPDPHGEPSQQSIAQDSQATAEQSSSGEGTSQMPPQQPILPYDNQPTASDVFQENQRMLKEQLVYPPVDPNEPLPPTKRKKVMPKTPTPAHHKPVRLNDPPEEGSEEPSIVLLEKKVETEAMAGALSQAGPSREAPASNDEDSDDTPRIDPVNDMSVNLPHNYEELDLIGNGAYGTVYRGRDLTDQGKLVALKKIRISLTEDGIPVNAVREIALLKNLDNFRHPNIVRLLDICHGRPDSDRRLNLVLVFEFIEMDLDKYLKKVPNPGLEPTKIKNLFHQLLNGVDFLHQNRVIHRDLKPQNILIDRHERLKIADFGLARIYDYKMKLTTMVVTLWYRAPEVLLSDSYASPVDIWSCACIFAELFRKRPLFVGKNESEQLQKIFEVIGTPSEREWPTNVQLCVNQFKGNVPIPLPVLVPAISNDACDLLQKMLKFVPDNRTSAYQSLRHPYFNSLKAGTSSQSEASGSKDPYGLGLVPMIVEEAPGPSNTLKLRQSSAATGTSTNPAATEPASNDENNPNSSNVSSTSQSSAVRHAPMASSSSTSSQSVTVKHATSSSSHEVSSSTSHVPHTSSDSSTASSEALPTTQSERH